MVKTLRVLIGVVETNCFFMDPLVSSVNDHRLRRSLDCPFGIYCFLGLADDNVPRLAFFLDYNVPKLKPPPPPPVHPRLTAMTPPPTMFGVIGFGKSSLDLYVVLSFLKKLTSFVCTDFQGLYSSNE